MALRPRREEGRPQSPRLRASEAAVEGFRATRCAIDHVKQNIRVNCALCPGVDTPSLDDRINAFADPVQARTGPDKAHLQPMGPRYRRGNRGGLCLSRLRTNRLHDEAEAVFAMEE
jgi:hypothetical protein